MVRTKVFVGNLSFTTKENELAKEFEVAGKVISANIITRGPRSLGYGFVEMDNETDAQNAVKLLDKKEIDGRPINVEVAKPREEGADLGQQANAQGSARGVNNNRGGPRRGNSSNRGTGRGGNNNGAPRSNQNQGQQQGQNQQSQGQQGQGQRRPPQSRRRDYDDENQEGNTRRQRPPRAPRNPRPEGEADTRTPSTTTLFVANLPFSIEDETFAKVLKDASLAYKTAHVVKKRTGRSKGFGFIEFDNEGDQQKALASLNNKEVEGRALAVKVALTELRTTEDNQTSSSSSSAPAKSTSSPSPAKTSSPAPAKNTTTQSTPTKTTTPASNEKKDDKPSTPKQ